MKISQKDVILIKTLSVKVAPFFLDTVYIWN